MNLDALKALWARLGNTPTREAANGELLIDAPFHDFPAGISLEEIWVWFEAQHPEFSVAEHMGAA